jgi:hypothetical protein
MRHEEGFAAAAAVGRTRQVILTDPVGGVAMGANNVQGISHTGHLSFYSHSADIRRLQAPGRAAA